MKIFLPFCKRKRRLLIWHTTLNYFAQNEYIDSKNVKNVFQRYNQLKAMVKVRFYSCLCLCHCYIKFCNYRANLSLTTIFCQICWLINKKKCGYFNIICDILWYFDSIEVCVPLAAVSFGNIKTTPHIGS